MSSTDEEVIEAYKEINIASYITNVTTLVLWIWVFVRILRQQDRSKFFGLIVICVLMIVSLIADIVLNQLGYTYTYRNETGGLNHYDLANNILQAC
jgi:hypothetical protein